MLQNFPTTETKTIAEVSERDEESSSVKMNYNNYSKKSKFLNNTRQYSNQQSINLQSLTLTSESGQKLRLQQESFEDSRQDLSSIQKMENYSAK